MSGFAAGRVWQSALDPNLKPIAACLADIGDDFGKKIFPSIAYVSWLTGESERSVQRKMSALIRQGGLLILRYQKGGRGHAREYQLCLDALPARPPWKEGLKDANLSPFSKSRKGDRQPEKGVSHGIKGDTAGGERVTPLSPQPLEEPPKNQEQPPSPPGGAAGESLFAQIYEEYPKRMRRLDAFREFLSLHPTPELTEEILAAVRGYKQTTAWIERPRYIPLLWKFLRRRQWLDCHPEVGVTARGGFSQSEAR